MRNDGFLIPVALGLVVLFGVAGVGAYLMLKRRAVRAHEEIEMRTRMEKERAEAAARASEPRKDPEASEVAKLRAELEKERKRAEAAEAKLEEVTGKPAKPKVKADEKTLRARNDAEWEARVKKVEWRKYTRTLVDYFKELDLANKENRAPRMSPEMIGNLTGLNNEMGALAKELGMENMWGVYGNVVVGKYFTEGYVEALAGQPLTPEQIQKVYAFTAAEPQDDGSADDYSSEAFNWLTSWKGQMEWNQRIASQMQTVLTPEQYGSLSSTLHSAFMVNGYKEQAVAASSPEAAAVSVGTYWSERLGLPESARSAVDTVASEFTRDSQRLVLEYTQKYGASMPRDRQIELDVKLVGLQIAAERRLAEFATLSEEQKQKALKGSGSVLRISYQ